jgi:hypothetical protein
VISSADQADTDRGSCSDVCDLTPWDGQENGHLAVMPKSFSRKRKRQVMITLIKLSAALDPTGLDLESRLRAGCQSSRPLLKAQHGHRRWDDRSDAQVQLTGADPVAR